MNMTDEEILAEPVAWMTQARNFIHLSESTEAEAKLYGWKAVYTHPQRTWVGLSEDDKVLINHDANFNQFMTAGEYADRVQQLTEARLKDKNT